MDKRFYLTKKTITDKDDIKEIINLITEPLDLTKELIIKYFCDTIDGKSKYKPWDEFILPKNTLYNDKDITTTIGNFIFVKFVYTDFIKSIGYQNYEFSDDVIRSIDKKLVDLVTMGRHTELEYIEYLDKISWIGFITASLFTSSISYDIFVPSPKMEKRKEELLSKNREQLKAGNAYVSSEIEQELLKISKEELKGHASMNLFDNGVGKFGNAYKNMSIMRGSVADLKNPGKFDIIEENYMDGFSKENYPYMVNMNVNGAYSKAVGTRVGGYETKKYFSSFQKVVLDEKDTDCGTNQTLKVKINAKNKNWFSYRYIKVGSKLVLLTPDNINDYVGKEIALRSPLFCQSEKVCNKCAGDYFYLLDIKNAGLTLTKAPNTVMMISMKAFHDQTIKINKLDWNKYVI